MGLNSVETIFNNLDDWRKLPAYQLERRADIFFATYLHEVLKNLKISNDINIIPEFPLSKKAFRENYVHHDSVKMDYLVLDKENHKAIFVELKTDMNSVDYNQYQNMVTASKVKLSQICQWAIEAFPRNIIKRRKYYHLLTKLNELGLIIIPESVKDMIESNDHRGIKNNLKQIYADKDVNNFIIPHDILYILPYLNPPSLPDLKIRQQVTFEKFAENISTKDELALRFIESLDKWRK
jgi:hypothetical protein